MPTRILGNPGAFSGESTRNFNGNPSIVRIRPEQSHSRYYYRVDTHKLARSDAEPHCAVGEDALRLSARYRKMINSFLLLRAR